METDYDTTNETMVTDTHTKPNVSLACSISPISDEEELINTKPRCLWPDDGRDYAAQEDNYYNEEEQHKLYVLYPLFFRHQTHSFDMHCRYSYAPFLTPLLGSCRHEDETRVEPTVQHYHDKHINCAGYEQQDSAGTPPPNSPAPTSPIPPSPYSQHAEYNENNQHDQHDTYEDEDYDPLPPHLTINRGYVAESITMIQHPSQPTSSQQEGDYTDEEDDEDNVGQDDTMYTTLYDSSDNEEASPMYSQENSVNPFEHIPNPEEDWLIAQERERQRIASKHKLGIVGYVSLFSLVPASLYNGGFPIDRYTDYEASRLTTSRGIKYPIPADLLEAPSPTTTFGRTTLWPIRVEAPESSMSRQRLHTLTKPAAQPNFSIGPAFNLVSTSATTSASASAFASISSATTSAPSAQAESLSTQVTSVSTRRFGTVVMLHEANSCMKYLYYELIFRVLYD